MPAASTRDVEFMARALRLARRGRTHPNPRVGAVIVQRGRVVGQGYHRAAGEPHAEVAALAEAGERARGATLYITLEPCNHQGRTPPCAAAILAAGIARVVVGARDPNPRVAGRGLRRLRRAGVAVTTGVLRDEAWDLNAAYNTFQLEGRPWVELKLATTLDGRIGLASGRSQWLTGPAARRQGHRLRAEADCVVVGAETLRRDDPRLTVRDVRSRSPQPRRAILTATLEVPLDRAIFREHESTTSVLTTRRGARSARAAELEARGVEVIAVGQRRGQVDPQAALGELARRHGVMHVLVEGGGRLASALLARGLVDRLHLFVAPSIMGGEHRGWSDGLGIRTLDSMPRLHRVVVRRLGEDLWIRGDLGERSSVYRYHRGNR